MYKRNTPGIYKLIILPLKELIDKYHDTDVRILVRVVNGDPFDIQLSTMGSPYAIKNARPATPSITKSVNKRTVIKRSKRKARYIGAEIVVGNILTKRI